MYISVFIPLLVIFLNEANSQPPLPPHHRHPGDKVVIVVQNENGHPQLPLSSMDISESKISKRKSIPNPAPTSGLKRRGQALQKHNIADNPPTAGAKKDKSLLSKLIPTSSRHIAGPSDMFRKHFHHSQKSTPGMNEKPRPQPPPHDFRPHQPDITPDMQGGKLSLPVGFNNDDQFQTLQPRPTPMANKINPYTNGVAASFPPGIDPYDGFMRYAAENLETPMGNLIDYHSLEHYFGEQHPLSPHYNLNNKDANLNQPYADSFSYNQNQIDVGNAPPPLRPPQQQPGFRSHDHNPPGQGNPGGGYNHPNSITQYEHGIDHFNAPSPGLRAAPKPRPPTDSLSYEDDIEHRTPPFEPHPHPDHPPFTQNHHAPPFKHASSNTGLGPNPQYHDDGEDAGSPHVPEPPDLDVFDEGPPQASHPPIPLPPDAPPHAVPHGHSSPPPHHQNPNEPNPEHSGFGHSPEHGHAHSDGGEDGIWGILDLAAMIEKGQIPGSPGKGTPYNAEPPSSNSSPSRGRIVIPIFTRPPPPRSSSNPGLADHPGQHVPPPPPPPSLLPQSDGSGHQDDQPPPIQIPHPAIGQQQDGPPSNAPKYPFSADTFDYDDNPGGLGGNFPGSNNRPAPQYGTLDSNEQEAGNDYNEDYKR